VRKTWWLPLLALAAALPALAAQTSMFDRLALDRLAAKHADVVRYAAARKSLPPPQGLQDLRAIIHVHSFLSHDSRGTKQQIAAAAKASGTRVVMLSDHVSKEHDYYRDGFQGTYEGVLFIPGAETRGFLLYPQAPLDPTQPASQQALLDAVLATGGVAFASHVEGWPTSDWPLVGLTGMELYNHHYDRVDRAEMRELEDAMTERPVATPDATAKMVLLAKALRQYPQETFAFVQDVATPYLAAFDRESQRHRLTAISANDTHAHWGVVVKAGPNGTLISQGPLGDPMAALDPAQLGDLLPAAPTPGQTVFELLLDSYERSFRHTSTHLLAPALDPEHVLQALRMGHAYVAFDWIADPRGFSFQAQGAGHPVLMGDEVALRSGLTLTAALPLPAQLRLLRNGAPVPLPAAPSARLSHRVTQPGVYRLEAHLSVGGEMFPWIYSNPIYVR